MDRKKEPPGPGLTELLGRALTDDAFRTTLFEDRSAAVRDYRLTKADREALDDLSQEDLQAQAERFRAGSAAGLTVSVSVKGTF